VWNEEPPADRFFQASFQEALTDAKSLMAWLVGVLESSNLHLEPDSTIRLLRQQAQELASFQCPPTRTVGFVGDSGVGKPPILPCWHTSWYLHCD
jgi:ABC-type transport system involved in Fe-S cluster assembly fused permease/ATPase subunit